MKIRGRKRVRDTRIRQRRKVRGIGRRSKRSFMGKITRMERRRKRRRRRIRSMTMVAAVEATVIRSHLYITPFAPSYIFSFSLCTSFL
uniref:Putative ovule protein n=1 Tax=Solanum chacoense TaxID=4108 RepID=A0A0V0GUR3_SOLCH